MKGSGTKSKVASSERLKCQPPVGLKTKFCHALDKVIFGFNEHGRGIYIVQPVSFSTAKEWVAGVAGCKDSRSRPILFNYCPFCGEDIVFQRPSSVKKKARDRRFERTLAVYMGKTKKARAA